MLAVLHNSRLGAIARPLASLLDVLPSLQQQREFATHGVADSRGSREGGVVRFYKAVNVKEAEDGQVLPMRLLVAPALAVKSQAVILVNGACCRTASKSC
jgi:hypothetical protein